MARPVWKGHISFGLINIPVTLYSAERRSDLHFRMLDSRNMAKVRYERVNEDTGEEVPWDQIVKGFEHGDGNYVVLDDEDFKKAAVEATQSVDLEGFVEAKAIDYVYFDKPYYLVPGKKAEKGYVLLRETLRRTGKVGVQGRNPYAGISRGAIAGRRCAGAQSTALSSGTASARGVRTARP